MEGYFKHNTKTYKDDPELLSSAINDLGHISNGSLHQHGWVINVKISEISYMWFLGIIKFVHNKLRAVVLNL